MWAVKSGNRAWINLPPFIGSCFFRGFFMFRVPSISQTQAGLGIQRKAQREKHLGPISAGPLPEQTGNILTFSKE